MNNPFDNAESPTTLTVSQLNRQVRSLLESHFDFVWVEGEISNFAAPSSGHWYFSLKDGNAQVRCAMFRNRNQRVRFTPEHGDAIRIRARVSLYEGRGEFQLIVEHLEHAGAGALQAQFEKLKARLLAEGLFDEARKQELPATIGHLGVVTSPTGAAIHDILTVLARRSPSIRVSLLPVAVQGEGAAQQIATAIATANRWQREGKIDLDALLVGRGGGSVEDLWAFNEEVVARAIADSALPVVSAVGHEVDFSISDMVADYRAATPSAAAELLSEDQSEWLADLQDMQAYMAQLLQRHILNGSRRLDNLRSRLRHPGAQLREQAQKLDDLEQRLVSAQRQSLQRKASALALLRSQLQAHSPLALARQMQYSTTGLQSRLANSMRTRAKATSARLATLSGKLHSLSPLATLERGYALVTTAQGDLVKRSNDVKVGDEVKARLAQGSLDMTVTGVKKR